MTSLMSLSSSSMQWVLVGGAGGVLFMIISSVITMWLRSKLPVESEHWELETDAYFKFVSLIPFMLIYIGLQHFYPTMSAVAGLIFLILALPITGVAMAGCKPLNKLERKEHKKQNSHEHNQLRKRYIKISMILCVVYVLLIVGYTVDFLGVRALDSAYTNSLNVADEKSKMDVMSKNQIVEGIVINREDKKFLSNALVAVDSPKGKFSFKVERDVYVLATINSKCYFIFHEDGTVSNFSMNRLEAEKYLEQ